MNDTKNKILFYFGHPAQYLFLKQTIKLLKENKHETIILIKSKDVLQDLLVANNEAFINIQENERGFHRTIIFLSFIRRVFMVFLYVLKKKPNLLIGTDPSIAIVGRILRKDRITILEDDYNVIKHLANICYPNTSVILCPEVCDVGRWKGKKIGYNGYMKLGYLHPNIFKYDIEKIEKYNLGVRYVLIRLARLTAHHDFGAVGINFNTLDNLIELFEGRKYSVIISSESSLNKNYAKYDCKIQPNDMHQVLAHASFLISDSQSMSVEAAMLGIPSIRVSSFAGKISVLEELEHNYFLTFGIYPDNNNELIQKTKLLLSMPDLKEVFAKRRKKMLSDKIDVTAFMVWFIENYPRSAKVMKENPDYQYNFK